MNTIYLRRRSKVLLKEGPNTLPDSYIPTLQKNLESLGFICSDALTARISTLTVDDLSRFYRSLIKDLQVLVGAHRVFRPMYPNFPEEVMASSAVSLYWNAARHYLTHRLPESVALPRPTLDGESSLRTIDLGDREDFESIFTQLVKSKSSWSLEDQEDVRWFISQYQERITPLLPREIPLKENLAVVGAALLQHTNIGEAFLKDYIKTATDVLRVSVALSGGDVSLSEPTKFVKLRRGERRLLLSLLECCGDPTEDMLRWKERWKRLGERIHPGDFQWQFPKSYQAFKILREDIRSETFNSKLESALANRDVLSAIQLLGQRPGEFARRLDQLSRLGNHCKVVERFAQVADKVSTPVLLQVLAHFEHRDEQHSLRSFFPKGDVGKVQAIANDLPKLPSGVATDIVQVCRQALIRRFSKLRSLGRCYIDPRLKDFLVPFSQRSASKSLRTLVRGSRLKMPDTKTIRFFLWWKNGKSRTDIDLSAVLYNKDFQYIDVVSYYNLKNFGGHHSGDIVDAPFGAAEFIDLDIERCLDKGVRYVVASINSFTEQPYCDLPECFAGWMARDKPNSGEIFEARTVQDRIDIASNSRICIPMVLDFFSKEVLWTDIALKKHPRWNNVNNNLSGISLMLRAMTSLVKPDLYTLFSLHVDARGECTSDLADAQHVFSVTSGITPFDTAKITADFL